MALTFPASEVQNLAFTDQDLDEELGGTVGTSSCDFFWFQSFAFRSLASVKMSQTSWFPALGREILRFLGHKTTPSPKFWKVQQEIRHEESKVYSNRLCYLPPDGWTLRPVMMFQNASDHRVLQHFKTHDIENR